MKSIRSLAAVILAAGKGTRMNNTSRNKVTLEINGVPMISNTIASLKGFGIKKIVVVVGFAKESVLEILDLDIITAEQKELSGTGGAVKSALKYISDFKDVLVVNGDDSFVYTKELYDELYSLHRLSHASITILSLNMQNPYGIGRVIRDEAGNVTKIVEERDAIDFEKKVSEVNLGCYIFSTDFLLKNIYNIEKSTITGEYYLTSLIDKAYTNKDTISVLKKDSLFWRGVNTPQDFEQAKKQYEI